MKKRILSVALCLALCLGLVPMAAAAAPEVGTRDMRSYVWTQTSQERPEATGGFPDTMFGFGNGNLGQYYDGFQWTDFYIDLPAHFILYDNGDLYLSQKEEPSDRDFHKVMGNVKEIGSLGVPCYWYRETYEQSHMPGMEYFVGTYREGINVSILTTILTEDGELYLMGIPKEIPEENLSLEKLSDYPGNSSRGEYRATITLEPRFPFSFADSLDEAVFLTDGVSHIVPGYPYSETLEDRTINSYPTSHTSQSNAGFYVNDRGESFVGFPTPEVDSQKQPTNVIDYLPNNEKPIKMLEDGTLVKEGKTVARNVKEFNSKYYLTNDGKVYTYAGKLVDSEVKRLLDCVGIGVRGSFDGLRYNRAGTYIKEDGSLWGGKDANSMEKYLEDVEAEFDDQYVVRGDGSVLKLDVDWDNGEQVTFRKFLSGNGYAPNPAPSYHTGKVFKDASSWALVDLRAARDSGLTIPTSDLSYNQPITREKFAEVSVKLYEALSGTKAPAATKNPFTDTTNPEILKAYTLGIVKGTSANTFSPDAKIDRESIATMLMRAVNAAGTKLRAGTPVIFADNGMISSWAKDAVSAMSSANIVRGVGSNRFNPKGTATVEEAIIMANRILG